MYLGNCRKSIIKESLCFISDYCLCKFFMKSRYPLFNLTKCYFYWVKIWRVWW